MPNSRFTDLKTYGNEFQKCEGICISNNIRISDPEIIFMLTNKILLEFMWQNPYSMLKYDLIEPVLNKEAVESSNIQGDVTVRYHTRGEWIHQSESDARDRKTQVCLECVGLVDGTELQHHQQGVR